MAKFFLAGGTDVAEVALFSIDALQERPSDGEDLVRLEVAGAIIRFPIGSDGGHLLHAYVDEPIPEGIVQHCDRNDKIVGLFFLSSGRVGFGGVESAFTSFKPNKNIRTDASFPPGTYDIEAFRVEFPDDVVEKSIEEQIGRGGMRLLSLPGYLIPVVFLLVIVGLATKAWFTALVLIAGSVLAMKFGYFRNSTIKKLRERKINVEMQYPSIVVALRSNHPLQPKF